MECANCSLKAGVLLPQIGYNKWAPPPSSLENYKNYNILFSYIPIQTNCGYTTARRTR